MNNLTTERMEFTEAEEQKLTVTFRTAFDKLKQSMPLASTSNQECNNHFDDKFHEQLLNGLHLKEVLI